MEHLLPWAAIPSQRRGNLPADGGMELNHRLPGRCGIQMLVGRRLIQLEILHLSSPEKLDDEAEMQQKQTKKCQVGWPESEIRAAIQVGHCILAKLHPERGDLTRFRTS